MAGECMLGATPGLGRKRNAPRRSDVFEAAVCGDPEWLRLSLKKAPSPIHNNKEGLTVLHVAAQHGQLECMKLLVEFGLVDVNASCSRGRRPLHMALCPQSRTNSHGCVMYLLEQGAEPNICTDDGLTPLHMASAAGLRVCVEMLVEVGADTHARDIRGHTPFDLACISGDRVIAKFLKNAMWQKEKEKDLEKRKALEKLRQNLILLHRRAEDQAKIIRKSINDHKVCEWAKVKGLPLLWSSPRNSQSFNFSHHTSTKSSQTKTVKKYNSGASQKRWNISPNPSRPPRACISRPQQVRIGVHVEEAPPEPDLRQSLKLCRSGDGHLHYTALWEGAPCPLPSQQLDVIQKCLFPSAFSSRITSPQCFQSSSSVLDLPHQGCTPGPGASPWSEVAMHLAETLELGHY